MPVSISTRANILNNRLYSSMKKTVFRYVCLAFALAVMVFIFIMSSEGAELSGSTSGRFIIFFSDIFVSKFRNGTPEFRAAYVELLQHFVRKTAHFTVFAALGFFGSGVLSTYNLKKLRVWFFSLAFCVLYAISDEIHQLFVSGRSGELKDVLIDSLGSAVGSVLMILLLAGYIAFRSRKNEKRGKLKQQR